MEKARQKSFLLVRHGNLDYQGRSPEKQYFYNRDEVMESGDRMHLSQEGEKQMKKLGQAIKKMGLENITLYSSPQIRALESAKILMKKLGLKSIEIEDGLTDIYAPGPYQKGMTMAEYEAIGGNVYTERWDEYNHERPKEVVDRMNKAFQKISKQTKPGEAAILVSHGDPLGWLIHALGAEGIPKPERLRDKNYPAKGEAWLVVINPNSEVTTLYQLKKGGEFY
jgi:broad specificity phosphatase PhoE